MRYAVFYVGGIPLGGGPPAAWLQTDQALAECRHWTGDAQGRALVPLSFHCFLLLLFAASELAAAGTFAVDIGEADIDVAVAAVAAVAAWHLFDTAAAFAEVVAPVSSVVEFEWWSGGKRWGPPAE